MGSDATAIGQDHIPTIRSNKPMAMAGAIVQNEFHHRMKVYSKALTTGVSTKGKGDRACRRTIVSSSHSRFGTTTVHRYRRCFCRRS